MTIIVEYREIKDKILVFKFKFNSQDIKNGENGLHPCSLDKYLSLECWTHIYSNLNKPIDQFMKNTMKMPKHETIILERAQLELNISWRKISSMYASILNINAQDMYSYFIVISVKTFSKISEFKKLQIEQNVKPTNGDAGSPIKSSNSIKRNHSSNSVKKNDIDGDFEEYVPTATSSTSKDTAPKYTPAQNISESEIDEYTPTNKSSNDDIDVNGDHEILDNLYMPSSSSSHRSHDRSPSSGSQNAFTEKSWKNRHYSPKTNNTKTERSKKLKTSTKLVVPKDDCNSLSLAENIKRPTSKDKINMSQDLFGESDGECNSDITKSVKGTKLKPEENTGNRMHLERNSKTIAKSNLTNNFQAANNDLPKVVPHSSKWLSKDELKLKTKDRERNANEENVAKEKKKRKSPPISMISADDIALYNAKQKRIEELKSLQVALNEMNKPIIVERFIDLKNLTSEEILTTFDDHSDALKEMFTEYTAQTSHRVHRAKDYNYLLVHSILLKREHVHKMVDKLNKEFAGIKTHGSAPIDDKLFWELMVPEWAIAVLMKQFCLTRIEAVKQIQLQHNAFNESSSSIEL